MYEELYFLWVSTASIYHNKLKLHQVSNQDRLSLSDVMIFTASRLLRQLSPLSHLKSSVSWKSEMALTPSSCFRCNVCLCDGALEKLFNNFWLLCMYFPIPAPPFFESCQQNALSRSCQYDRSAGCRNYFLLPEQYTVSACGTLNNTPPSH